MLLIFNFLYIMFVFLFLCIYTNPATGCYMNKTILYNGHWWVGCYIWYNEEGTRRGYSPPSPLLAVPNVTVTALPSTASVQITVLLYNDPLLCGFNVHTKGLNAIPNSCNVISLVPATAQSSSAPGSRSSHPMTSKHTRVSPRCQTTTHVSVS